MSLTIFSNFRINTEENFLRMKESFNSFKNVKIDKWVINFRGSYKDKSIKFLSEELGDKLIKFELNSNKGWFHDTKKMLNNINTEFVFYWIEDHINISKIDYINRIISEMSEKKIDYLGYSWFGLGTFMSEFNGIRQNHSHDLVCLNYDNNANTLRQKNSLRLIGFKSNIISLAGIYSIKMFIKIIKSKKPYLRRWPKQTPFDFEKKWCDTYILPVKMAIPKYEIFSNIDDDNLINGSSLISRRLYPKRVIRKNLILDREDFKTKNKYIIIKKLINSIPLGSKFLHLIKRITYHI